MPRPKLPHPTPGELEILNLIWERGPLTVRQVLDLLNPERARAYTSVMTLLNVMTDKGLLKRKASGRAFVYAAVAERQKTLGKMLADLLGRAFQGSPTALVAQLLEHTQPSAAELAEIRSTVREFERTRNADPGASAVTK